MRKGGNMPCILNAANEIAVSSFLNDEIAFIEIPKLVEHCMNKVSYVAKPTLKGYIDSDAEARKVAQSLTKKKIHS